LNQEWLGKEYSLLELAKSGCDMKEYPLSQEWLGKEYSTRFAISGYESKELSIKSRVACVKNTQRISRKVTTNRKNTWNVLRNINLLSGTQSVYWEIDVFCCNRWTSIKYLVFSLLLHLSYILQCIIVYTNLRRRENKSKKVFNQLRH